MDYYQGAKLLIDKPSGWTSFDVVNKIRFAIKKSHHNQNIKVGHSGTLDPMATGLLLICTGRATKEIQHLQGLDKEYVARITLGISSDTYDAEGLLSEKQDVPELSHQELEDALQTFIGEQQQIPPIYSAIKKDGKKAYELARAGVEVVMQPRTVRVYSIRLEMVALPDISVRIHCGSGYYVRSFAHDLGVALQCGAHLSGLRRTRIGDFTLDQAVQLPDFIQSLHGQDLSD